jgi:hypothetical protein
MIQRYAINILLFSLADVYTTYFIDIEFGKSRADYEMI